LTVINDVAISSVPSRVFRNEPPIQAVSCMRRSRLFVLVDGYPADRSLRVASIFSLKIDFPLGREMLFQSRVIRVWERSYDVPFAQSPVHGREPQLAPVCAA